MPWTRPLLPPVPSDWTKLTECETVTWMEHTLWDSTAAQLWTAIFVKKAVVEGSPSRTYDRLATRSRMIS